MTPKYKVAYGVNWDSLCPKEQDLDSFNEGRLCARVKVLNKF